MGTVCSTEHLQLLPTRRPLPPPSSFLPPSSVPLGSQHMSSLPESSKDNDQFLLEQALCKGFPVQGRYSPSPHTGSGEGSVSLSQGAHGPAGR